MKEEELLKQAEKEHNNFLKLPDDKKVQFFQRHLSSRAFKLFVHTVRYLAKGTNNSLAKSLTLDVACSIICEKKKMQYRKVNFADCEGFQHICCALSILIEDLYRENMALKNTLNLIQQLKDMGVQIIA